MNRVDIIKLLLDRLKEFYGAKFDAQWSGVAPERMVEVWGDALRPFSVEQLKRGLEYAKSHNPFPPTVPEFVGLVRQFRDVGTALRLPAPRETRSPEVAAKVAEFLKLKGKR